DINLIRVAVNCYARRPVETRLAVVAFGLARVSDLQNELAGRRELEHMSVLGLSRRGCPASLSRRRLRLPGARYPDVAFVIHGYAAGRGRPVISGAGSSPMREQVSRLVELQHRRRRHTTSGRRFEYSAFLVVAKRVGSAVNNPDMVLRVHRNAGYRAEHPVIRKRLGPKGIHFKLRRLEAGAGLSGRDSAGPCNDKECDHNHACVKLPLAHPSSDDIRHLIRPFECTLRVTSRLFPLVWMILKLRISSEIGSLSLYGIGFKCYRAVSPGRQLRVRVSEKSVVLYGWSSVAAPPSRSASQ